MPSKSTGPVLTTVNETDTTTSNLNPSGTTSTSSKFASSYSKSFTGQEIKDFYRRMRSGDLLPHTDFRASEETIEFGSGSYNVLYDPPGSSWSRRVTSPYMYPHFASAGDFWEYLNPTGDHSPENSIDFGLLVNEAANRTASQGVDSLTLLAEIVKTKRLVGKFLKHVITRGRTFPKNLHEIPGAWLEARYGLRPLIYDYYSIQEAIEGAETKRTRFSERAGTSIDFDYQRSVLGNFTTSYPRSEIRTSVKLSARGSVTADFIFDAFRFWRANFIESAWELTPWSFVVDWGIDIGSYLQTRTFMSQVHKYVASYGWRKETFKTVSVSPDSFKQYYSGSYTNTWSGTRVERVRIPTSVTLRTPQVNPRLDLLKTADLAALIVQARIQTAKAKRR